ncbi:MAG: YjcQ family protein [Paeniclostridium sp.]
MKSKITLKIMYSILKEFSEGNTVNATDYGIETIEFCKIMNSLQDEGLIKGFKPLIVNQMPLACDFDNVEVTMKGLKYLSDNSNFSKGYKTIKEIKSWLPL